MINSRAGIRAMKRGLLAVFLVLAISSASQAGPIGVVIEPFPNILAGFITSKYIASTGAFTANGLALTLDEGNGEGQKSINASFLLTATIENSGVFRGGTLTIGTALSPLVRSIDLTGFAYNPVAGGVLEFLFANAGGSYFPSVYNPDKPVDVMLTVGSAFLGNFNSSWTSGSNTAQIREDGPIPNPEPSTLLLMLTAAGGFYTRLRKRGVSV